MPDTPTRDTVYFYKFSNYYNRIIKRYDTIAQYTANGILLGSQANCNFVHGDGVNSSFTWNKLVTDTDSPDYVVVEDYKGNISRWFVVNSFKSRDRQDILTLRRDVIADYYSDIVNYSPCLIRKGYVPQTNPLIFNDEGVQYNKIKQQEILIKDRSNCSYIIGFIASNTPAVATVTAKVTDKNYNYHFDSVADMPYNEYVEGAGNTHTLTARHLSGNLGWALRYCVNITGAGGGTKFAEFTMNINGAGHPIGYTNTYTDTIVNLNLAYGDTPTTHLQINKADPRFTATIIPTFIQVFADKLANSSYNLGDNTIYNASLGLLQTNESVYNVLKSYDGAKIEIGSQVYTATLKYAPSDVVTRKVTATSSIAYNINRLVKPSDVTLSNYYMKYKPDYEDFATSDISVLGRTTDYYLDLTPAETQVTTEIEAEASRTHLEDSPYDMFMLINESGIEYSVLGTTYKSDHVTNMAIAQALCQASGSASYDVQIVPFNPIQGTILDDDSIDFQNFDVVPIKDANNTVVGHYVMCPKSAFTIIGLEKNELKINPTDYKKDFNLNQYRLCSPNQETIFDFSPAMNGGIDTWEISCNYKPYASYIKVQPTWKWQYGESTYNNKTDFRGLVYNSTLSITQLTDQWATYVSNNKNFQQLFDNQIGSLTKTQQIQLNAMEETLGLRAFTGMPVGSVLRTIGGSKDIDMQRELNNVALSKMNTDYKYQMDNIKSMPHTLKKLTSITEDTRIFPYIEVYTCSEQDESAFVDKMKYTGYTIMKTGRIIDYCETGVETFVQASLIRLVLNHSEETADNHIAVEIASELDKGIYITKEE